MIEAKAQCAELRQCDVVDAVLKGPAIQLLRNHKPTLHACATNAHALPPPPHPLSGLSQFIPFDPPKPRPFSASVNDFQKV